ncbi:hypothetical protein DM02DRAFT_569144 [Periconia macrospinosa]|uniref:F-box domain-containing protein n=1 Tax=Periconia macrospinosa TaxID=97972 RepID=A0A2V1DHU5_9PLEO|nr:hypothetical protein DM02DRAFT_569144 [Periconia macrospinosa]
MAPNRVTPGPTRLPSLRPASPTSMSDSSSDHEPGGITLDPTQVDMSDYPSVSSRPRSSSSHLATPSQRPSSSRHPPSTPNRSALDSLDLNHPVASSSRSRVPTSRSPDHSQLPRPSFGSPPDSSFAPISDQDDHQENDENMPPPSPSRHNSALDDSDFSGDERVGGRHTGSRRGVNMSTFLGLRGFCMDDSLSHQRQSSSDSSLKRSRDAFEILDEEGVAAKLEKREAVATLIYRSSTADPRANDVWPNFRNTDKLPARYNIFKMPECEEDNGNSRLGKSFTKNGESRSPRSKMAKKGAKPTKPTPATASGPFVFRSKWGLPVELMEVISSHLNRDDIKSMRLVSKELNHFTSQILFKTVVVPFNTEIYGMLDEVQSDAEARKEASAYTWTNKGKDDVYKGHGLDVFRGFGRHILRFGMSFEVTEDALVNAPKKTLTEEHTSFWGSFRWPHAEYCRFDDVAGLETAADETPRMTTAFSELSKVQELALSIDSGLGWMNGPDRSIRAQVLQKPPAVFGTLKKIPDRRSQAQQELWDYIEASHKAARIDVKLASLYKYARRALPDMTEAIAAAGEQPEMPFLDPPLVRNAVLYKESDGQSLPSDPNLLDQLTPTSTSPPTGILFTSTKTPNSAQLKSPLLPTSLTIAQKEWLLETEWAQGAFVSSYMLSVIDNPTTFRNVHTLNISRMSDRYIHLLTRPDFWDALPKLKTVTLMVIPSFRKVSKDEAGCVDTRSTSPEEAIVPFYQLLSKVVSKRRNITDLTIGWATGGEHAEGVHARNKLILPAPLTTRAEAVSQDAEVLKNGLLRLPFVEKLTLKNCWLTPSALVQFCEIHDKLSLEHLVLNSVSLTGTLRTWREAHLAPFFTPPPLMPLAAQWQAFRAIPQHHGNAYSLRQLALHIHTLQAHVRHMQELPDHQFYTQLAFLRSQLQGVLHAVNQQFSNQVSADSQTLTLGYGLTGEYQQQVSNVTNIFSQVRHIHQQLQTHLHHHHQQQQQQQQQQQLLHHLQLHPHYHVLQQQIQEAMDQDPPRDPLAALQDNPLPGSWMRVIDIITPGPNLSDFGSAFSEAVAERETKLQSIEFISCGYVRLTHSEFKQLGIEDSDEREPGRTSMNHITEKRGSALNEAMLNSKYPLLGSIVQTAPKAELCALNAGWFFEEGWKDAEEARAVAFDGLKPGGTGRFTGILRKEDKMMAQKAEESC